MSAQLIRRFRRSLYAPLLLTVSIASCSSSMVETDNTVASIEIAPITTELKLGTSLQLTYAAKNAKGEVVSGADIKWTSGNALAAAVSSAGLVTAISEGQATIQARSGGVVGTVVVTAVLPPAAPVLAKLSIASASARVVAGTSNTLLVSGADQRGREMAIDQLEWHSTQPSIASISNDGVLLGIKPGVTTVYATSGAVRSDSLSFLVTSHFAILNIVDTFSDSSLAPGQRADVYVTEENPTFGFAQPTFLFQSSNSAVATVNTGTREAIAGGEVVSNSTITAVGEGTTTITATANGVVATQTIVVRNHGLVNATFLNAATGFGPITITTNATNLITLSSGQQQTATIPAVRLTVSNTGFFTSNYRWFDNPIALLPNRDIALVGIGNSDSRGLFCLCDMHDAAPTNRAPVRVLMGSNVNDPGGLSVYVVPAQGSISAASPLEVRLVHLSTLTSFVDAPSAIVDIVLVGEPYRDAVELHPAREVARISGLSASAGHSTTFVVTGDSFATLSAIPIVER